MGNRASAIVVLIVVNAIFFGVALISPEIHSVLFQNLALYFPKNQNFGVWQVVTTMFMHAGFAHILFNMYALWAFGSPLEQMWGKKRFVFFYFMSGIGASFIYTLVNYFQFESTYNELVGMGVSVEDIQRVLATYDPSVVPESVRTAATKLADIYHTPAVGASGAIYGVLVAFGMSFPNAKLALIFLPVPIAAKYFIPILIGLDLFSGITGFSIFGGGIAHFAHIGGAIIGFLLMWYWRRE